MKHLIPAAGLIRLSLMTAVTVSAPGVGEISAIEIPDPVNLVVRVPGGQERIFVQTPARQPADRPMIVIFLGAYYDEHWKSPNNSLEQELRALFDEAARRGWYAVSINGGEARLVGTYAGPELHRRTTAVIEEMEERYRIDRRKIYMLGYSMGGIDAMNYAARHVDPERYMIAGVWCWSGALCAEVSQVPCHLVPYNSLARIAASVVQTSCGDDGTPTGDFVVNESLAWNLEHVPITTAQATRDINHVNCPSAALQALTAQWKDSSRHRHLSHYGKTHNDASAWNPARISDFFNGRTLTLPTFGTRTVAVEDARYFYFQVSRTDVSRTGVFGWDFQEQELSLHAIENIAELELDLDGGVYAPLTSQMDLTIKVNSTDQQGTDIVLQHCSGGRPVCVTRNGIRHSNEQDGVWAWDHPSSRVTLFGQPNAAEMQWVVDVP